MPEQTPITQSTTDQPPQIQNDQQEEAEKIKSQLEGIISESLPPSQPNSKIILITIILTLSATVAYLLYNQPKDNQTTSINSYQDCVAAGYPIMESYPEQCATPDGRTFTNTPTEATETRDQPSNPITNLITFTDQEERFSFQHNSDLEIYQSPDGVYGLSIVDNQNEYNHQMTIIPSESINKSRFRDEYEYLNNLQIGEHYLELAQDNFANFESKAGDYVTLTRQNDAYVNTYQAKLFTGHREYIPTEVYIINHESNTIIFEIMWWSKQGHEITSEKPIYLEAYNQILSTFQFINPSNLNYLMPELPLPAGLEPAQLKNYQQIDNSHYSAFLKLNMNHPIESSIFRSGYLISPLNSNAWKVLYEIIETGQASNNPYLIWKESDLYYTVIVDTNGAGSGEGIAKLLSINLISNSWNNLHCFYYTPENFNQFISTIPQSESLSKKIIQYQDISEINNSRTENPSCSNFNIIFP